MNHSISISQIICKHLNNLPISPAYSKVNHILLTVLRYLKGVVAATAGALYHAVGHRSRFTVKSPLEDGTLDIIEQSSTFINSVLGSLGEGGMSTVLAYSFGPNTANERGRTPWVCATARWCLGAIEALLGDVRMEVYHPLAVWWFGAPSSSVGLVH